MITSNAERVMPSVKVEVLEKLAREARKYCLDFGSLAGTQGAHYGPALSMIEIMTTVVADSNLSRNRGVILRSRDRLILSKGHGSLALYVALFQAGIIDLATMQTCEQDGTLLPGQPIRNHELGIEFSSGSLGMGLGFGVGLALSGRLDASGRRVVVVMGDGETNEGSVWESAMSAAHFGLQNLVAIIDANDMQSDGTTRDVMTMQHVKLWEAVGWKTVAVDGHSIAEIRSALRSGEPDKPLAIIAKTIKGKGISFMENSPDWHHGFLTPSLMEQARAELEGDLS